MMSIFVVLFGFGMSFFVCLLGLKYYLNGGLYRRNCKHMKVSLIGKTVIITGGNSGIGKETAIDLARRGARVFIACRNRKKAEKAVKEIKIRSGSFNVFYRHLELSYQVSVRRFAEEFLKEESRLDYLINNAGIFEAPGCHLTSDGYDLVFAINHLGHFLLTLLLLDLLKKSTPSRIINVSSMAYIAVKPGDMNFKKKDDLGRIYPGLHGYPRSKLANILFTKELARRLAGTGVTAFALHPGSIKNEFLDKSMQLTHFTWPRRLILSFKKFMLSLIGSNSESGAQTTIYCVIEASLNSFSGRYFDNCRLVKETDVVSEDGLAKKLWDVSCEATGVED